MNAVEMINDGDPKLDSEVSARRFGAGLRSVQSIVWPSVVGVGASLVLLNAGGSAILAGISFAAVTAIGYEVATRIFKDFTRRTIESTRNTIAKEYLAQTSSSVRPEEE